MNLTDFWNVRPLLILSFDFLRIDWITLITFHCFAILLPGALTLSGTFLQRINSFDLLGILCFGDFPIGPDFNCLIFSLGESVSDHSLYIDKRRRLTISDTLSLYLEILSANQVIDGVASPNESLIQWIGWILLRWRLRVTHFVNRQCVAVSNWLLNG